MIRCQTQIRIKNELRKWIIQLKIASYETKHMELKNTTFQPIGKVMIEFLQIDNLVGVKQNSMISIKVDHRPFSIRLRNNLYRSK